MANTKTSTMLDLNNGVSPKIRPGANRVSTVLAPSSAFAIFHAKHAAT